MTPRKILLPLLSAAALSVAAAADPLPGQIVVAPDNPAWLMRADGSAFFLAAPGDPEDFLHRGRLNPDGTRDGDQEAIIDAIAASGANGLYLMAVRSHGGDGDETHNPFVDHDPANGLNDAVLDQWEDWFARMDDAGIIIFFIFYDDGALVWDQRPPPHATLDRFAERITGARADRNAVPDAERAFLTALVDRFEHHANLIWVVAEEYQDIYTPERTKAVAAVIRAADDHDHPIAVHSLPGLNFSEFAGDPAIDQFAIQFNDDQSPAGLHRAMTRAWSDARGRYNLNMAEIHNGLIGGGDDLRRRIWAMAMGGAYVMAQGLEPLRDPEELAALGRLRWFFERAPVHRLAPADDRGYAETRWMLAAPGEAYLAYASDLEPGGAMGVSDLEAGDWALTWFDPATGIAEDQRISHAGGDAAWPAPGNFGAETALLVTRIGDD